MGMGRDLMATTLLAAGLMTATPATAGIPIPCTSDKSFKMAKTGVPRQDGKTVYLGYKYAGCFSGEWIGYIDGNRYLKLPNDQAALALAAVGGMAALPEPPSQFANPKAFWVEWLWVMLLGLGAVSTLFSAVARADERSRVPPVRA